MRNKIFRGGIGLAAVVALWLVAGPVRAVPVSTLPNLSALADYTLFGNNVFLNLATANGNVGISANGKFQMSAPSYIDGRLDLDTSVTTAIADPTHISGGIVQPVDLSAAQAAVLSASNILSALTPDYSFGAVSTAMTLNAVDPVTVINVASIGGAADFMLNGGAGDYFVLNVAGAADFTGSTGVRGVGAVDASHILINFYDSALGDLGVVAHINDVLNGTTLVPYDAATFHSENGAIYGGNGLITLMSGAQVASVPLAPPSLPEPPTVALIALGLAGVASLRAKRSRRRTRL